MAGSLPPGPTAVSEAAAALSHHPPPALKEPATSLQEPVQPPSVSSTMPATGKLGGLANYRKGMRERLARSSTDKSAQVAPSTKGQGKQEQVQE